MQQRPCTHAGMFHHMPWGYEVALRQQMRSLPAMQLAQEEEAVRSDESQEARLSEDACLLDARTGGWGVVKLAARA